MSVISSPIRKPRRWLHLWPLALFLLFAVCGALWLWQAWPQVMMKSIIWQREVNQQMSGLLKAVAENPAKAGGSLLAFSFVYGVLHALGPGHGKIVITTWLATHPSKLKSSIGLTPLRRTTFMMNTAAAVISICPRRNNYRTATTGAPG